MIKIPCPDSIRSAGRSDEFFGKTYDVLKEYFGEKNVHGGFVHKDAIAKLNEVSRSDKDKKVAAANGKVGNNINLSI